MALLSVIATVPFPVGIALSSLTNCASRPPKPPPSLSPPAAGGEDQEPGGLQALSASPAQKYSGDVGILKPTDVAAALA
jgi:hypothetical protein